MSTMIWPSSADFSHATIKHRLSGSLERGEGEPDFCAVHPEERVALETSEFRTRTQVTQGVLRAGLTSGALDCQQGAPKTVRHVASVNERSGPSPNATAHGRNSSTPRCCS